METDMPSSENQCCPALILRCLWRRSCNSSRRLCTSRLLSARTTSNFSACRQIVLWYVWSDKRLSHGIIPIAHILFSSIDTSCSPGNHSVILLPIHSSTHSTVSLLIHPVIQPLNTTSDVCDTQSCNALPRSSPDHRFFCSGWYVLGSDFCQHTASNEMSALDLKSDNVLFKIYNFFYHLSVKVYLEELKTKKLQLSHSSDFSGCFYTPVTFMSWFSFQTICRVRYTFYQMSLLFLWNNFRYNKSKPIFYEDYFPDIAVSCVYVRNV